MEAIARLYFIIPTFMACPFLSAVSISSVFKPAWHGKRDSQVAFDGISLGNIQYTCMIVFSQLAANIQHSKCVLIYCMNSLWQSLFRGGIWLIGLYIITTGLQIARQWPQDICPSGMIDMNDIGSIM